MRTATLAQIADKIDYGVTASAIADPVGPKFLRITDIQDDAVDWETVPFCNAPARERRDAELQRGDIVFARTGATTGKSYLIGNCPDGAVFASYLIRVRPAAEVDSGYLSRFFQSAYYWAQIASKANGAAQPGVNASKLGELVVPLPPLPEQRRIAAILDQADALRRLAGHAVERFDELLSAEYHHCFGDPASNSTRWPMIALSEALDEIEGGWSPTCLDRAASSGEWGVLKLGAVTYGRYNPAANKALPPNVAGRPGLEVRMGDILFSRKNTYDLVGASVLVTETAENLMIPDLIFRLKLKTEGQLVPEFLQATLATKSMRAVIKKLASGAAGSMPNISKGRLANLRISRPPIDAQLQYAKFRAMHEARRRKMKDRSSKLDHLFTSLQHRAFRGEL